MASILARIKNATQTVWESLSIVFSHAYYVAFFLAATLLSIFLLITFTSIPGQSMVSWLFSVNDFTKAFVPLAGILLGLTVTSQVYVWRHARAKKTYRAKNAGWSLAAFVSALLSTACCSSVVIAFFGLAGFGTLLTTHQPFFLAFSLLLLLLALYYSTKVISCQDCQVRLAVDFKR